MTKQTNKQIDLAEIRRRLASAKGKHYWQSLDELAETEEFQQFLNNEFPHGHLDMLNPVTRRTFLKLMGASFALAGLTACSVGPLQPEEKIVPYVVPPPEEVPGVPLFFASAIPFGGYGKGIVVMSHEGRPTKIEGNIHHPASLGSSDLFTQASILTLYDPDRSQKVLNAGSVATWQDFVASVVPSGQGEGFRILTGTVTSPLLTEQFKTLLEKYPAAKWYQYEPISFDSVRTGARLAFDEVVQPIYHFDKAEIILSLDSDFLSSGPGAVRYARDFADGRRVRKDRSTMNRLYVVESTPSITGSIADHRLPLRAGQVEDVGRMIAEGLGIDVGSVDKVAVDATWIEAVIEDLNHAHGASIVIAGEQQPPELHALAHAMNHALGNIGHTVFFIDPVESQPVEQVAALKELVNEMKAGHVDTLLIIGGNPAYDAPADLDFAGQLPNVKNSVHLSLYEDETSELCRWHIPAAHFLEMWGDVRSFDGTVSLIQPLIAPLYGGKSPYELLATYIFNADVSIYDQLRTYWSKRVPGWSDRLWESLLQKGVISGTSFPAKTVSLKKQTFSRSASPSKKGSELEIVFRPDPSLWDGSFANNAWLQELPRPLTKITWENVVMVSPATAQELGLDNDLVVDLSFNGATARGPVWITPGHADNSVTVYLGSGRTKAGHIGNGIGFNAYPFRTSNALWFASGLTITSTGQKSRIASTQYNHSVNLNDPRLQALTTERVDEFIIKTGTVGQFRENAEFLHHGGHGSGEVPSIYPKYETASGQPWKGHSWAMVIDLNTCIGCNACVIACNAENNIPIVGKEEVIRGREMHWIRIDRYYKGDPSNPEVYHMPLGCVQCEKAPCEPVCPVGATSHSLEGLNDMTYNRCVGTRYCANNCPYKVRRFNFYNFAEEKFDSPSLRLMKNPNVTVRTRGVMEKCTYCVQRINAARIVQKRDGTPIKDGDIVMACESACPTKAITFGDISDPDSRVSLLKAEPHGYGLLAELATFPRTSYLARLRNPNSKIEPPTSGGEGSDHSGEEGH